MLTSRTDETLTAAALFLLALLPLQAAAEPKSFPVDTTPAIGEAVESVTTAPAEIKRTLEHCQHCAAAQIEASRIAACHRYYEEFYSKPETQFVIGFGYGDSLTRGIDLNASTSADFIEDLTRPCGSAENRVCGFEIVKDDATLFKKTVDIGGKPRKVEVRVVKGSDAPEASEWAHSVFLEGLKSADAVFYLGHSRDGGGPDFAPALYNEEGHIDYPWYRENRPGMEAIDQALDGSPERPLKVYGSFSCLSKRHFLKDFDRHAPKVGLIFANQLATLSDAPIAMKSALNGLLSAQCKDEMQAHMNAVFDFIRFQ